MTARSHTRTRAQHKRRLADQKARKKRVAESTGGK